MKRFPGIFLALIMILSLVFSATVATAAEKKFADIKNHWAQKDIELMAARGIINGISDTEFAPNNKITRSAFLALVVRTMKLDIAEHTDSYSDIKGTEWYATTVQTAKNNRLIDPGMTPDNSFKPNEPITREEMASLIVRAYEAKAQTAVANADISIFADKGEISSWALGYVQKAYNLGIIKGVSDTEFSPKSTATRAQAATIMRRFLSDSKIGKTIRILAVGNSYSVDSMEWLYGIFQDAGYDNIILGNLHYSNCSLAQHNGFILSNTPSYSYRKNTEGKWTSAAESQASIAITEEPWDYVVIGSDPRNSGNPNSFSPYLETIIKHLKSKISNPNVKFGYNMTWAAQQGFSGYGTVPYNDDQMTMYNAITDATKTMIAPRKDIEFIIPSGTAIQNARTSYIGDNLTRDGHHLDNYIGRYIAALSWFSVITGTSPEEINYVPNDVLIHEKAKQVANESVANAIKKPYAITKSKITE